MYNIKRQDLVPQFQRSYDYYLGFFEQLLKTESNLIIFGDKDLKDYVWQRRK
jgi:hypothetical protein